MVGLGERWERGCPARREAYAMAGIGCTRSAEWRLEGRFLPFSTGRGAVEAHLRKGWEADVMLTLGSALRLAELASDGMAHLNRLPQEVTSAFQDQLVQSVGKDRSIDCLPFFEHLFPFDVATGSTARLEFIPTIGPHI